MRSPDGSRSGAAVDKAKLLLEPRAERYTAGKEGALRVSLNARGQDQVLQGQQRKRSKTGLPCLWWQSPEEDLVQHLIQNLKLRTKESKDPTASLACYP